MSSEPKFMAVGATDPAYQKTIADAQASLDEFDALRQQHAAGSVYANVKCRVEDGENVANLWLAVLESDPDGYFCEVFESPAAFVNHPIGHRVFVPRDGVLDWSVNDDGSLFGGYSIRYQRERLPARERAAFDEHVGVKSYAPSG